MPISIRPVRLYKDIDLSFTAHPQTGDVSKKLDINAVKQALYVLLFTKYGEVPFDPNFGSPLYRLLFENVDPIIAEGVRQQVERTIQNFEPRIRLDDIYIYPSETDDNAFDLSIFFTVVGIPSPATFSVTLNRLR